MKILLIFLIILIILLVTFSVYLKYKERTNPENEEETDRVIEGLIDIDDPGEKNTVISCVQTYIDAINNKDAQLLMFILDKEYIEKNNINDKNVIQNVKIELDNLNIDSEIKQRNLNVRITNYYIKALNTNFKLIIKLDYGNGCFSIVPCYNLSEEEFLQKQNQSNIEENQYNIYKYQG